MGDSKIAVHDDCQIFSHNENPLYLAYCFQTRDFAKQKLRYVSEGKVTRIAASSLSKIKIPIPSHEKQARIARVLNEFESLLSDVTNGLPAEIEARHKQYEYYRDKLLAFKKRVS